MTSQSALNKLLHQLRFSNKLVHTAKVLWDTDPISTASADCIFEPETNSLLVNIPNLLNASVPLKDSNVVDEPQYYVVKLVIKRFKLSGVLSFKIKKLNL